MSELKDMDRSIKSRVYTRVRAAFVVLVSLYGLAVLLIMMPIVQTHVLYAHHFDYFTFNRFDHPEHYGLAPGKTVNLHTKTSDNTTIGAWFVYSDQFYRQLPFPPAGNCSHSLHRHHIATALKRNPTILYLHGNTGTRAHPLRTILYNAFTSKWNANVLAIDYRGFGDSKGHPTVQGVSTDARAGWNYLMQQGAKPEDVLILGHSLGTAISGLLAAELGREGIRPRGTVLMSPFSSIRTLINEYPLFGFLPLLKPLSMIPLAPRLITWCLAHRFDTLTLVPDIKSSVLIAHADNDFDIPSTHAMALFDAFLSPHLPSHTSLSSSPLEYGNYSAQDNFLGTERKDLILSTRIKGYGLFEELHPDLVKKEGRRVALLRTESGRHDIGRVEGVQDAIGRMFRLYQ